MFFTEKLLLQLISVIAFISIVCVLLAKKKEIIPKQKDLKWHDYDWKIIVVSLFPMLLIAIGAGLTIPFVGLFFYKIHGLDSDGFAILSAATTVIVFAFMLLVPVFKRKLGYTTAITASQGIAVVALAVLACTELFAEWRWAFALAMMCFFIRQPERLIYTSF